MQSSSDVNSAGTCLAACDFSTQHFQMPSCTWGDMWILRSAIIYELGYSCVGLLSVTDVAWSVYRVPKLLLRQINEPVMGNRRVPYVSGSEKHRRIRDCLVKCVTRYNIVVHHLPRNEQHLIWHTFHTDSYLQGVAQLQFCSVDAEASHTVPQAFLPYSCCLEPCRQLTT